jgi:MFS superfamily sulfate permease-like transporter
MKEYLRNDFFKDFIASIVVFLVALPLCLGIAIASGVPPILGLICGIIGGIVVGTFAGCPLQVSGPAAGLAAMVFAFVDKFGVTALAPLGIVVGLSQVAVYYLRLGTWFKAISPALVRGMLAGIGFLILMSQFHVALDAKPTGKGLNNLAAAPGAFMSRVVEGDAGRMAFYCALGAIVLMVVWERVGGKIKSVFPAALIGILVVSAVCAVVQPSVLYVNIPDNLLKELTFISSASFQGLGIDFFIAALGLAFVASAETLLCVNATDKMSGQGNSDYNKEIRAQGFGNFVVGLFGAIPMTGVIVRSSANIQSGAKSRISAILHGVWMLAFVFGLPWLLELIPTSALAAILLLTGWKLLNLKGFLAIAREKNSESIVFFATFGLVVGVDLLTGVIAGFVISVLLLMLDIKRVRSQQKITAANAVVPGVGLLQEMNSIEISEEETAEERKITFKGKVSFLHVPKISDALVRGSVKEKVTVDLAKVDYLHTGAKECIEDWLAVVKSQGIQAKVHYPELVKAS